MRSYGKPISPTQLSRVTGGSIGSMAYHIRTLVAAGVVELVEEGRARGAVEHFYELVPTGEEQPLPLTDPVRQLLSICGALTIPDPDGGYPRPVKLDDRGAEELLALLARVRPEVQEIASSSTERRRNGSSPPPRRA